MRGVRRRAGRVDQAGAIGAHEPYLSCTRSGGGRGCIGILLHPTEDYVRDRLFAELDKPEFLEAVAADDHAGRRDELARAAVAVDDSSAPSWPGMWAGGGHAMDEWRAARAGLDQRERTLRAELAAIPAPRAQVDIGDVRAAWPAMTLEERRELLRMFIDRVVINRKPQAPRGCSTPKAGSPSNGARCNSTSTNCTTRLSGQA